MKVQRVLWLPLMLTIAACSGSEKPGAGGGTDGDDELEQGDASEPDGDDDSSDGDGNEGDQDGDGGDSSDLDAGTTGDGGQADSSTEPPKAEICDGIDNDRNGVVDDLDAEKDGVCDCLNIATIGQIGPWSNGGNVFKTWLSSRSPAGAVELANQTLTDELLARFQVIVVLHVGNVAVSGTNHVLTPHHEFSADEAAALERWVRRGGGLMTTIGYGDEISEVVNANRLLTPLGMAYSTTNKDTDGFVMQWETHPISENVKKIYTENGVQPAGAMGMTLARDTGGRVALQVTQAGDGRVVVWGDEWITYDSEWQDTADKQVDRLWLNMLKWMSPPKVCQVALPPILL